MSPLSLGDWQGMVVASWLLCSFARLSSCLKYANLYFSMSEDPHRERGIVASGALSTSPLQAVAATTYNGILDFRSS